MTIRTRLIIVILVGMAITIAAWGWMQIGAIERFLCEMTPSAPGVVDPHR